MLALLSFSLFIFLVHGAISTTTETPSNKGLGGLFGHMLENIANVDVEILKKSMGNDSLLDEDHKKLIEKMVDGATNKTTKPSSDNGLLGLNKSQNEALLIIAKKIFEKMGKNSTNDENHTESKDDDLQPVPQNIYPQVILSDFQYCWPGPPPTPPKPDSQIYEDED